MRRDVSFPSSGGLCRGWLYLPDDLQPASRAPAIVMANAVTAIKEITLPEYAARFAAAGFVTLAFDYRCWGESDGEPRQHFVAYEQQQDIRNALTFLATQPEVDPERVGGWGISMGGAHMLYLAAFERRLKAVVTTAASVSAVAINETWMPREALQDMFFRLGQDRVQRYETGSPATIVQAWGRLGDDCALPNDEAYAFYTRAQQERAPTYQNRITLQSVQNMSEYNPDFAIHLASPTAVLIIHSKHDLIPVSLLQDVYQRALEPKKILVLDCKHTDLYDQEPWLTRSADAAIEWFRSHLQHHDASGTPPERREEEGMTIEQNKEIMRRMIDEIWNNGNLMTADELFSPTHTSPSAPDLPPGPQSVKMLASMFRNAMPDYHMNIDLLMADEDSVVGRFTQSGTHTGAPLMGLEPSGRKATWTEIGILRIAGGKVVESWYEVDMLAMMNQLNPQAQAA